MKFSMNAADLYKLGGGGERGCMSGGEVWGVQVGTVWGMSGVCIGGVWGCVHGL